MEAAIHLSKLINEHFSNSYFLTKAPMILNDFTLIMSISMNQRLEVFRDSFHLFYIFGVQNVKINVFGKKKIWVYFSIKLKCGCL